MIYIADAHQAIGEKAIASTEARRKVNLKKRRRQ